jgi:hypothetical protein
VTWWSPEHLPDGRRQAGERHLKFHDERADTNLANLAQLVQQLEQMASRPLWREAWWVFCDRCGCSVDTDLIHLDGHHYADDGNFYCVGCRKWNETERVVTAHT